MDLLPQPSRSRAGLGCSLYGLHPVGSSGARCSNAVGWYARRGGVEMKKCIMLRIGVWGVLAVPL